ncbi:MAG: response regulator transcription factor [Granulicella sp.]
MLIVEDDSRIQRALERQFTSEGYAVQVVGDGLEALAICARVRPAAVVLDLMLPGLSGREVCKRIKAATIDLPVIILSAVSDVVDKVLLLELGADDYMTKPFSPRELLARVQAAIRRANRLTQIRSAPEKFPESTQVFFGNNVVDFLRMELHRAGELIPLTAHDFKLLKYFIEHAERLVTREELLNDVWGYSFYPSTRTVDNHILKLRQKLEQDPAHPLHFKTVHGSGYKFVMAPVDGVR